MIRNPEEQRLYTEKEAAWRELSIARKELYEINKENPAWTEYSRIKERNHALAEETKAKADQLAMKMREMYRLSEEARDFEDYDQARDYGLQGRDYEAETRALNDRTAELRKEINEAREEAKEKEKEWLPYREASERVHIAEAKFSEVLERWKTVKDQKKTILTANTGEGIELVQKGGHLIPDYLEIENNFTITVDDHVNPAALNPCTAYIYNDNLYLTDKKGQIAFVDLNLRHVSNTSELRKSHPEYRKSRRRGDAGHFGLALGQHPSITMDQDAVMNRRGIWRAKERYWNELIKGGQEVRLYGVFSEEGDYWLFQEDGGEEYVFTNDDEQS